MKKYIFCLLITIMLLIPTNTNAAIIRDAIPLGGMSYYLDIYYSTHKIDICTYLRALDVTDDERQILYRIVEAEVTGGTIEQKKNVASLILNRVMDSGWGNTVSDVVFAKQQFAPVSDGRYYSVSITEDTKAAVDYVLRYGTINTATYFCTPNCRSAKTGFHSKLFFLFNDGVHNFYKDWR